MYVFRFQARHLQKVFEDVQPALTRDRGEFRRRGGNVICHVGGVRRLVGNQWIGHCGDGALP